MSDIVKAESVGLATTSRSQQNYSLSELIKTSQFLFRARNCVPSYIKNESELFGVLKAGQELGLEMMASLRGVQLVEGKVVLSYDTQLALLARAGYKFEWLKHDSSGAELRLVAPDGREYVSKFTAEDAKTAGLATRPTWQKYPEAMMQARSVSKAGRAFAPHIMLGVYSEDEADEIRGSIPDAPQSESWKDEFAAVDPETGETRTAKEQNDAIKRAQDEALAGLKQSLAEQLQACSSTRGLERIIWDTVPLIRDYPKANFYQQAQKWMMVKGERLGMSESEVQQLIFTAFEQSAGATEEGEEA